MASLSNNVGSNPYLTVLSFDLNHHEYGYTAFCTKLYFRLRHGGLPYETAKGTRGQAPKGKMPYARFEKTGELMGDSSLITQRLIDDGKLEELNAGLAPEQRAADFCLRSMVDDRMYYLTIYERFFENAAISRDLGPFAGLPWGVRHVAFFLTRRYVGLMLYFQGTGRHSRDELTHLRREAVGALADYAEAALKKTVAGSSEPFWILGGEKPTEADFTLFGYLANMCYSAAPNPFTTDLVKQHAPLVSYVERIHRKYFPDFKDPL